MHVVDFAKWKNAWINAVKDYNTDHFDSLLLADHQLAGGFIFESVLSCAIAIERSKYRLWNKFLERGHCSVSEERSARNDTKGPERYFSELLPSSAKFQKPNVEALEAIRRVWIARGLIAHGKEMDLSKALSKSLENKDVSSWIDLLWELAIKIETL